MSTANAPYNTPETDQKIWNSFCQSPMIRGVSAAIKIADTPHAIRNIAVVGGKLTVDGVFDREKALETAVRKAQEFKCQTEDEARAEIDSLSEDRLADCDVYRIAALLNKLSEAGIPVHPECKFWIYDLAPPISSDFLSLSSSHDRDFRRENHPESVDVVLCSYIYGGINTRPVTKSEIYAATSPRDSSAMRQRFEYVSCGGSLKTQPRESWINAARALRAKFVVTSGGQDEINTAHFGGPQGYLTLIDTSEIDAPGHEYEYDFLGYCINPEFLPAALEIMPSESELGKRLHQQFPKSVPAPTIQELCHD